jgi:hypothetical protein
MALQLREDRVEFAQRHALLGVLQAVEGGGRDAQAFGKAGVGLSTAALPQEASKLFVQGAGHLPPIVAESTFRMWNVFLAARPSMDIVGGVQIRSLVMDAGEERPPERRQPNHQAIDHIS